MSADWEKDANEIRALEEGKSPLPPGLTHSGHVFEMPVRKVRWLVALGYWSERDSYSGEYDSGFDYLGRITLTDIVSLLQKKEPS